MRSIIYIRKLYRKLLKQIVLVIAYISTIDRSLEAYYFYKNETLTTVWKKRKNNKNRGRNKNNDNKTIGNNLTHESQYAYSDFSHHQPSMLCLQCEKPMPSSPKTFYVSFYLFVISYYANTKLTNAYSRSIFYSYSPRPLFWIFFIREEIIFAHIYLSFASSKNLSP